MEGFEKVIIPEINNGQLVHLINAKYGIGAKSFTKIQGMPFTSKEIQEHIIQAL